MKLANLSSIRGLWLLIVLLLNMAPSCAQEGSMKVHIIDIGQGSAALLEFSCGVVLIDVGGEDNDLFSSETEILEYLDEFFASRPDLKDTIDLLILSHPHKDHTRSVETIDSEYVIKNVITNGQENGSGKKGQIFLHKKIAAAEGTTTVLSDDIGYWESRLSDIPNTGITNDIIDPINCTDVDPIISILWGRIDNNSDFGQDSLSNTEMDNGNNHSVVVRVTFGDASILLPGDLEEEAIEILLHKYHESLDLLDVDVYVVGHHGSRNGTTKELVDAMSPRVAVISCGSYDRQISWSAWAYGHPNSSVIRKLEEGVSGTRIPKETYIGDSAKLFFKDTIQKAIYCTAWDGDIVLVASDGNWTVSSESNITLLNIKSATKEELMTLPSIGEAKSQAIIDYRTTNPIENFEDLDNVPGIGPATIARIRAHVRFE